MVELSLKFLERKSVHELACILHQLKPPAPNEFGLRKVETIFCFWDGCPFREFTGSSYFCGAGGCVYKDKFGGKPMKVYFDIPDQRSTAALTFRPGTYDAEETLAYLSRCFGSKAREIPECEYKQLLKKYAGEGV